MSDVEDKPAEAATKDEVKEEKAADSKETNAEAVVEDVGAQDEKKDDDESADENGNAATTDGDNVSAEERKIIRQVEYYFGDANLNRDKFLRECISQNEEGWVPFSVLLTFKRLAALTTDATVLAEALLKSDEGLLDISEDREKVRRHPERPLPEHNDERRKEVMSCTVYIKGFPLDVDMAALIDFFAPYEKVLNINMRKYLDKPTKTYKFKGSAFVTFEKKEQAQKLVEKEKVLYKERELIRKWQEKYLEEKKEESKAKALKKKSNAKGENDEKDKIELPKGAVLFFEGATETVTRELLREAIENIDGDWEVAYIDFSKGDKDGHIRFHEEDIAAKFIEKLTDNKLKLADDVELTLRTLSNEEENDFLEKAIEQMKSRRNQQHKNKGGQGNNRKRRGGGGHHDNAKKRKETPV